MQRTHFKVLCDPTRGLYVPYLQKKTYTNERSHSVKGPHFQSLNNENESTKADEKENIERNYANHNRLFTTLYIVSIQRVLIRNGLTKAESGQTTLPLGFVLFCAIHVVFFSEAAERATRR